MYSDAQQMWHERYVCEERRLTGFSFEEFDRRAAPPAHPSVTIQKRGTFGLNRAAHESLGSPTHVKLLFDPERRVIGIIAASAEDPNAYRLQKQQRARNYLLSGRAFANRYGIPLGQARRYRGEMHGDVLTVDLQQDAIDASWPPKERDEFGRIPPAE